MPTSLTCKCGHKWTYTPTKPNPNRRYTGCPICKNPVKLPRSEKDQMRDAEAREAQDVRDTHEY